MFVRLGHILNIFHCTTMVFRVAECQRVCDKETLVLHVIAPEVDNMAHYARNPPAIAVTHCIVRDKRGSLMSESTRLNGDRSSEDNRI